MRSRRTAQPELRLSGRGRESSEVICLQPVPYSLAWVLSHPGPRASPSLESMRSSALATCHRSVAETDESDATRHMAGFAEFRRFSTRREKVRSYAAFSTYEKSIDERAFLQGADTARLAFIARRAQRDWEIEILSLIDRTLGTRGNALESTRSSVLATCHRMCR